MVTLSRPQILTRINRRNEEAAEAFMVALLPGFTRHNEPLLSRPASQAWVYIQAAYKLYDLAWDCHNHDIREWHWPIRELTEGADFTGPEPWKLLFREALRLMKVRSI